MEGLKVNIPMAVKMDIFLLNYTILICLMES